MVNWSEKKAKRYSNFYPYLEIENSKFKHLKELMIYRYVGAEFKQASIHLVSSFRQSCFIAHRKKESAIFFDIYQFAILIKLARQLSSEGTSYIELAETIKSCCALHIKKKDPQRSKLIQHTKLSHNDNYFQIDIPSIKNHYYNFNLIKKDLRRENVSFIVEQLLLSHECYHYVIYRNLEPTSNASALRMFDFSLNQVCYEKESNFEEIAMYNGNLTSLSFEKIEQIRQDLKDRRRYYESNKEHLVEEINCDIYAFSSALDLKLGVSSNSIDFEELLKFSINYYIIFCLLDLHIAMNKRSMISVYKVIDDKTPANIADMNLRKVAMVRFMFDLIFYKCFGNEKSTEDKYYDDLKTYSERVFDVKMAMDFLYVMPITNLTREYLMSIEEKLRLN